ncbi:hypothetical protein EBZU44_47390 [Enterobacter cloacae]|nr:hypothetical protein EBZU44_47390 [Enterobacter cloacae]
MNATGLNIIKTLGCMTAVTFFTIYNTWDHYDYDYHWILGFLTFISTIATPLFFVVAGYLDGQSRHGTRWQLDKIKSLVIVFLFWVTIYYLWEPYQRGYLIQPRFVFAFVVIYTFHPAVEWLSQRRTLFCGDCHPAAFSHTGTICCQPSILMSTCFHCRRSIACGRGCCFYLTGQLFCDPQIAAWIGRKMWSGQR